jgi:DNA-binding beta-propeller fold protein YncE
MNNLKILALSSVASLPLIFETQNLPLSYASIRQTRSERMFAGLGIQPLALGVWEGEVDLANGKTSFKQIRGDDNVLVAAVLGPDSKIIVSSYWGGTRVYNNASLLTNGGNQFASVDVSWRVINKSGTVLGQTTGGGTTGIRLQLMPYQAGDGTSCETGATTLQQPICVVRTTIPGGKLGASGRTDGSDPVYLAYKLPSGLDDPNAPELNEATGRIGPKDFARTVWLPNLLIQDNTTSMGGRKIFLGMRFRYQQVVPGDGQPRVTLFRYKFQILADRNGGAIAPTASNAYVTTIAGDGTAAFQDGMGAAAKFNTPRGVVINPSGTILYVTDNKNYRIRAIHLATSQVTTLAGDGTLNLAPSDLAIAPNGGTLYVAEPGFFRISAIDLATKQVTKLRASAAALGAVRSLALNPRGTILYLTDGSNIKVLDLATNRVTTLVAGGFNAARGIALNPSGTILYVADRDNHRIRAVDLATNQVTTIAGDGTPGFLDGTGTNARFFLPVDVAVNADGTILYVADSYNNRIRAIDLTTNQVSTLAGNGIGGFRDEKGTTAKFSEPASVAVNPSGTMVYAVDAFKNRIRQIQAIEGVLPYVRREILP